MKRALLLLPLCACQSWEPAYTQQASLLPPVALDTKVALVEATNARVFLFDPAHPEGKLQVASVVENPVLATRHRGKDELVVLSRGERGEPGVAPRPAALTLVPSDATAPRVLRTVSRCGPARWWVTVPQRCRAPGGRRAARSGPGPRRPASGPVPPAARR